MLLTDYKPVSKLVLPKTLIDCPKFPVIDAHDHLGEWFGDWSKLPIQQLLDLLDEANVKVYVDLDGGWGEDILIAHLDAFKNAAPERFQVFGGVNWEEWGERVGYCTLYGDMNGGLAVLGDVPKTLVYELARKLNAEYHWIPERVLARPPSAELRPDQKDEDSLPPYGTLDSILHAFVEKRLPADEIIAQGWDAEMVGG